MANEFQIEDHHVVTAEKASLQKGMNYGVGKKYSVFLMSLRENAPYADALDQVRGMLTYEGHDEPQRQGGPNQKGRAPYDRFQTKWNASLGRTYTTLTASFRKFPFPGFHASYCAFSFFSLCGGCFVGSSSNRKRVRAFRFRISFLSSDPLLRGSNSPP